MMAKQQPLAFTVDERGRVFELTAIARCNSMTGEAHYSKPAPGQYVLVPGVLLHDEAARPTQAKSMAWNERYVWLLLGMLLTVILGQFAGYFP